MSSVAAVVLVALLYRLICGPAESSQLHPGRHSRGSGRTALDGRHYRWNDTPWDDHWINIAVPARLKSEPNLYLTMGTPTNSFVAPYLSPGAGLVNFIGQYTLGPDGANGARIASLVNQFAPNIRMLIRGQRLYRKDEGRMPTRLKSIRHSDRSVCASMRVTVRRSPCTACLPSGIHHGDLAAGGAAIARHHISFDLPGDAGQHRPFGPDTGAPRCRPCAQPSRRRLSRAFSAPPSATRNTSATAASGVTGGTRFECMGQSWPGEVPQPS